MVNLKKILTRNGYTRIKLKKTHTNHFELKVKINHVKGRFILDTGASNSCVGFDQVERFKLTVEDSDTKAAGAGAVGMETKIAPKNIIEIGAWTHKKSAIVIIDLSHVNTALENHNASPIHGIIGADLLEKGEAIIDYKRSRLYLKKGIYKY